jgi:signal transduction histidine kinase
MGEIIMIIASMAIYYSSVRFRQDDFYDRLSNKARSTARLLLDYGEIDAVRLKVIEKDNPINLHNEKIIILNYQGMILYSTDEKREIKINVLILEHVISGRTLRYKQGSYEVMGTLFVVGQNHYVLIAAATDPAGIMHLKDLRTILIEVCLISLLLFGVVGWVYSGRALKPISDVINKVEDISITSLHLRVPEGNGTDEIGKLAKTFNKMLERLETSFAMQKDFIANASHELRTPLTSINGQLDVLMMKDRSTDEYKAAIGSVLDDIKSLIDLSNRLLLIARASAEGPANLNKKIRIDEILWQAREELLKFNNNFHINISMGNSLTDASQMVVVGDEYLLKVAVSNIIDNACKYSPDHTVDIKLQHIEKWIELIFQDQGIGISEKDIQKVFEPFYRGANTISLPGSGIGLTLVNQIITNYNGTIKLSSIIGKGTRVSILLPTSV